MTRLMMILLLGFAVPVRAEVPQVVTDIAPVQSLVAQVMQGVGEPALILPPRASPHGYAMRPSEARALAGADLVVWVGPALTRWLAEPIATLAPGAVTLTLLETPDLHLLRFREGDGFSDRPHAHDADIGHDDDAEHDDAEHDKDPGQETTRDIDPHLWLDPRNGALWLGQIAQALTALDPENAETYAANAAAGQAALVTLEQRIAAQLTPLRDRPFIVYHDAFHYFEARFGIEARAAVSDSEAATPGAARIARLRDEVRDTGAVCAFAEPQFNTGLLDTVTEGREVRSAILDPLGSTLTPGPALYPTLLAQMADVMAQCLTP